MNKEYGFVIQEYKNYQVETLVTGDGKTAFGDVEFKNGDVGITMTYGTGLGIGVKVVKDKNLDECGDENFKWMVRFDNHGSIDSMIETLQRAKAKLRGKHE